MIADIVVAAILLISAVISFLRGLIREVLTIVGIAGGLVAAYMFGGAAAGPVKDWLGVKPDAEPERLWGILPYDLLSDILGYGGVFVVVVVALSVATHFAAEGVRKIGLGPVDRTFGVLFGLARGVLVLGLLYMPFFLLMDKEAKAGFFKDSKSHFYLEQVAGWMAGFLPEETLKEMRELDEEEASEARKKLEEMKILPKNNEPAQQNGGSSSGYTEEFRDQMDRLFQQETDPEGRELNE